MTDGEGYDDTENWRVDQEQRAIYFDEKASEFRLKEIVSRFDEIDPHRYDWTLDELNISEEAWAIVVHSNLRPVEVFCHPKVVSRSKHFVVYFQFLAVMSSKSLSHLGFRRDYEKRYKRLRENEEKAIEYARRVNKIVSTMVENRPSENVDADTLLMWRSMQAGSTSGGSWRNEKGKMEEIRLKRRVFKELQRRGLIDENAEYAGAFGYSVDISSGHELRFGSEPDIGVRRIGRDGYDVVVEIKGGIDPAGVLERFGAILKSFENELEKNPDLSTFLTVQKAAYTEEAKRRVEKDDRIQKTVVIEGLTEDDYEDAARRLVEGIVGELEI